MGYQKVDSRDVEGIQNFIKNIDKQERELTLVDGEKIVGAILTPEQYEWFLDQVDESIDYSHLEERKDDFEGSQSL